VYQRKDAFYDRAKRVGYRSRAAYKLEQLAQQYRLLRPGDRVLDLGAWPGGWLQVVANAIGPSGKVVGVDLQKIDPLPGLSNVTLVRGDIFDAEIIQRVIALGEGRADVILSDLAPKLSGVRQRDAANAMALAEATLVVASRALRAGGALVIKLFMSPELPAFLDKLRGLFGEVHCTRPLATRKGSSEIYAIARRFSV
jgi:23S rRNA (uridine2552-2'-O)-methyltransferase